MSSLAIAVAVIWQPAFAPLAIAQDPIAEAVGGQELDPNPSPLPDREPFATLSAVEAQSKLVIFLITDEDPLAWTQAKRSAADKNRLGGGPDVWCGASFRRSFDKLLLDRPDLRDSCIAQRVVAGLPSNLTDSATGTLPPRTIVAISDGQYRLLQFSVGVPEPDELARMIEDAQENRALVQLHGDDPKQIGLQVLERSKQRVGRNYREFIDALLQQMSWDETLNSIDDAWIAKYARYVNELRPHYLLDVSLRFGLTDSADRVRLLVLEQHCETRHDWCESLAPYLVGRPLQPLLHPLIESTWGTDAVLNLSETQHEEVLTWFTSQQANATIVLAIQPSVLDRDLPWPPLDVGGNSFSNRDWSALETAMSAHHFRTVHAEELAVILAKHDGSAINLLQPTRARYVYFEPGKKKVFVIRESDLPGKFINRFERR